MIKIGLCGAFMGPGCGAVKDFWDNYLLKDGDEVRVGNV